MTLPNFLILGAAKAGTTALYFQLRQHPDIFLSPVKEPHFFSYLGSDLDLRGPGDYIPRVALRDFAAYQALFAGAGTARAIGEASPTYLYVEGTAGRIRRHLPGARLVVSLRQPAERAFSAYLHVRRDDREPLRDFAEALAQEPERIAARWEPIWHYAAGGYYYRQLLPYFEQFPKEQIHIILYEEYRADPTAVLTGLCRFLGVDDAYSFAVDVRPNVSGLVRSRALDWLMARLFLRPNPIKRQARRWISEGARLRFTEAMRRRNLERPTLAPDLHRRLTDAYREDIRQLEGLIGRDLSVWLTT